MYSNIYEPRKIKTFYNLRWMEYLLKCSRPIFWVPVSHLMGRPAYIPAPSAAQRKPWYLRPPRGK